MARGTSGRLHFIDSNNRKVSGFTLLELLIVIAVVTVLATAAAPSFSSLIESNKVKRLATEIVWLLVQAKSEAVMRNEEIYVHSVSWPTSSSAASTLTSGCLVMTLTSTAPDCSSPNVLAKIDNTDFSRLSGYQNLGSSLKFDRLTGRPKDNGHYGFYSQSDKRVKVIVNNITGRLYACSLGGEHYNYEQCP